MTLKVRINGQMRQITGVGNSPVTFINGTKKKLVKGVTFINGAKKVLWDTHSLHIWKINVDDFLATKNVRAFNVNNKYAFLSDSDQNIYKINIENKNAPVLVSSSKLGNVTLYSPTDSTNSIMVYYAIAGDDKAQQINVNVENSDITASNVINIVGDAWGNSSGGLIGSNIWLGISKGIVQNLYANTTYVGNFYSSGASTIGSPTPLLAKRDATSYLGCGNKGLSVLTASNISSRVSDVMYERILVDGDNIVCAGVDGFAIFNESFDPITEESVAEYRSCYLLGKINNYYYVVEAPRNVKAIDKNIYLKIYTTSGVLFEQKNLDISTDFGNQSTSYVEMVRSIPHISQSGMLACYVYPSVRNVAIGTLVVIQGY